MNLVQIIRIIWARKFFVASATIACTLGAFLVTVILPPRWEATSEVMLGLLKPDPVTGMGVGHSSDPNTPNPYVVKQIEMVTDYSVAGRVADQLGWTSDPNLIAQYAQRPKSDVRDYRHWLAQLVIDRTRATVADGGNILEIKYDGATPDNAKVIADAVRQAYLDTSLAYRRDDAARNADWFAQQSAKAKTDLDKAQADVTAFEKANGIVMTDSGSDVDTAHLRSIAAEGAASPMQMTAPPTSLASIQLAQIDAKITEASQTLGPNHPAMIQLRAQRANLASQVAKDQAAAARANAAAANSGNAAITSALASQKSRVIAQAEKLQHLSQLQTVVDVQRDVYDRANAREAQFRQQAAAAGTELTPIGVAFTPRRPQFPNMLLIIGGGVGLGLTMGAFAAMLAELLTLRVRGVEDLESTLDAPFLVEIAASGKRRGKIRLPKLPAGRLQLKLKPR